MILLIQAECVVKLYELCRFVSFDMHMYILCTHISWVVTSLLARGLHIHQQWIDCNFSSVLLFGMVSYSPTFAFVLCNSCAMIVFHWHFWSIVGKYASPLLTDCLPAYRPKLASFPGLPHFTFHLHYTRVEKQWRMGNVWEQSSCELIGGCRGEGPTIKYIRTNL